MRKLVPVAALAAMLATFALAPSQAAGIPIVISQFTYVPGSGPAMAVGSSALPVMFVNLEINVFHTASYPVNCGLTGHPACQWSTGRISSNSSADVSISPGTYTFYCQIHNSMRGAITVA